MDTHMRAWCLGVMEAASLVAIAVVPLFVNYYGFRVFELGKASAFLALVILIGLVGVIAIIEARGHGLRAGLKRPLVVAALLLWIATALATVLSIVPLTSLLGSNERAQGLVALTGVLTLFGAIASAARDESRRNRIVAVLTVASVPVSVFALLQSQGVEVVPGEAESAMRAFGTLSNPIFLGAYLMMLVPLGAARMVSALVERRYAVAVGYWLVVMLQVVALVATLSRGPLLGLLAGVLVFVVAWSAAGGRRWLAWTATIIVGALLLFGVALNTMGGPLDGLKNLPVLDRVSQISQTGSGSQAARLRIWSGVDDLVTSEPKKLAFGYGPEALKYALLPYAGPNIAGRAQADRLADRSHNVLLDALVMTGVPGALSLLLVYGTWIFAAAAAAGLVHGRPERLTLIGLLAAGTTLGALTRAAPSAAPYAGALTLLGMAAGAVAYLYVALLRRKQDATPDPLRIALLAVGVAVVVEGAFGIQTVVTQVVFWAIAGLVVGTELGERDTTEEVSLVAPVRPMPRDAKPGATRAPDGATVTLTWSSGGMALGLVVGAALSVLVYDFVLNGVPRLPATLAVVVALIVVTWLAGLLAAADLRESVAATALTGLATVGSFALVRSAVLILTGDAASLYAVTIVWLIALSVVSGIVIRPRFQTKGAANGPAAIAYPILAIGAVALLFLLAIQPVQADIYFQSAVANFDTAIRTDDPVRLQAAEALFLRAVMANPREDLYQLEWGERYTLIGSAAGDANAAAPWFQKAQARVAEAERLDPEMPYHTFNRGHLQLVFAQMLPDGDPRQAEIAGNAEVALQEAFDRVPSDPVVSNELGLAKLLTGDTEGAIAVLEYASTYLDAENPTTWRLLGRAYAAADRQDDAAAAANRAVELGGGNLEDLLALGDISRRNGDIMTAVEYYEQALASGAGAGDWTAWFNLGLMYRDLGRTDDAMNALSLALQRAPQEEVERVQAAIEELLRSEAGATP